MDSGVVYVFERPAGGWSDAQESAQLGGAPAGSLLGASLAMTPSGDLIFAGAHGYDGAGTDRGAILIYTRPGSAWTGSPAPTAMLSGMVDNQNLGSSIAISSDGSTLATGAYSFDGPLYNDQGAVYVFLRPGGGWVNTSVYQARLVASNPNDVDYLGYQVAISGDGSIIAAGVPFQETGGLNRGAVYVYQRPGGGWLNGTEIRRLHATSPIDQDALGAAIALSQNGDILAAGCNACGQDIEGYLYLWNKDASGWANTGPGPGTTFTTAEEDSNQGYAVAISGDGGGKPPGGGRLSGD